MIFELVVVQISYVYCHFTEAIHCLEKEIVPKPLKVGTSVEYRKSVAIGLFYKVVYVSHYSYR